MTTKQLLEEVLSLPVEERALFIDSLLRSLNTPDAVIDAKWTAEANRRLHELRSGDVPSVPGDTVFNEVYKRIAK